MYTLAFALVVGDRAEDFSVWSLGSAAPSRTDELVAHTPAMRAASNRWSMVVELVWWARFPTRRAASLDKKKCAGVIQLNIGGKGTVYLQARKEILLAD